MAVVDEYVNSHYNADGTLAIPGGTGSGTPALIGPGQGGSALRAADITFETVATDSSGSIKRLWKQVPLDTIIDKLDLATDGITTLSTCKVGVYNSYKGGVAGTEVATNSASLFGSGIDLSSAVTFGSPKDGLVSVAIENRGKSIRQLLGYGPNEGPAACDIALTYAAASTLAATIAAKMKYRLG